MAVKPTTEPMVHRKDDHIESEGPTEDYHQKITRSNLHGDTEVTYFNRLGQEIPEAGNQSGDKSPQKPGPEHKVLPDKHPAERDKH